jgi:hypothetical protein
MAEIKAAAAAEEAVRKQVRLVLHTAVFLLPCVRATCDERCNAFGLQREKEAAAAAKEAKKKKKSK